MVAYKFSCFCLYATSVADWGLFVRGGVCDCPVADLILTTPGAAGYLGYLKSKRKLDYLPKADIAPTSIVADGAAARFQMSVRRDTGKDDLAVKVIQERAAYHSRSIQKGEWNITHFVIQQYEQHGF